MLSPEERLRRLKARKRRKYLRNRGKILEEAHRRWASLSPEQRATLRDYKREQQRKYRAKQTPEALARKKREREYAKRWNAEHPDRHLSNVLKWQAENPGRLKLHAISRYGKRKARKFATAAGPIDYLAIPLRTFGCCGICGEQVGPRFHYDHKIPLAKGGSHTTANIQLSHPRCNVRKSAKLLSVPLAA